MKDITPERFKCAIATCSKIELDGEDLVLTGPIEGEEADRINYHTWPSVKEVAIRLPFAMVKEALESLK